MAAFSYLEELVVAANLRSLFDGMMVYFERETEIDLDFAADLHNLWVQFIDRTSDMKMFIKTRKMIAETYCQMHKKIDFVNYEEYAIGSFMCWLGCDFVKDGWFRCELRLIVAGLSQFGKADDGSLEMDRNIGSRRMSPRRQGKQEWTIEYIKRLKKNNTHLQDELREANRANKQVESEKATILQELSTLRAHTPFLQLQDELREANRANKQLESEKASILQELITLRAHNTFLQLQDELRVANRANKQFEKMSVTIYERTRQEIEVHFRDPQQFQEQRDLRTVSEYNMASEFSSSLFQLLLNGAKLNGSGGLGDLILRELALLNVSSLVEAHLDFSVDWSETSHEELLRGLLESLKHVKDITVGEDNSDTSDDDRVENREDEEMEAHLDFSVDGSEISHEELLRGLLESLEHVEDITVGEDDSDTSNDDRVENSDTSNDDRVENRDQEEESD
nr:hypothetical protein [Tanacetum cinerariifolium]